MKFLQAHFSLLTTILYTMASFWLIFPLLLNQKVFSLLHTNFTTFSHTSLFLLVFFRTHLYSTNRPSLPLSFTSHLPTHLHLQYFPNFSPISLFLLQFIHLILYTCFNYRFSFFLYLILSSSSLFICNTLINSLFTFSIKNHSHSKLLISQLVSNHVSILLLAIQMLINLLLLTFHFSHLPYISLNSLQTSQSPIFILFGARTTRCPGSLLSFMLFFSLASFFFQFVYTFLFFPITTLYLQPLLYRWFHPSDTCILLILLDTLPVWGEPIDFFFPWRNHLLFSGISHQFSFLDFNQITS